MKKKKIRIVLMLTAFLVSGCSEAEQTNLSNKQTQEVKTEIAQTEEAQIEKVKTEETQMEENGKSEPDVELGRELCYEAESGILLGGASIKTEGNITFVEGLEEEGDGLELSVSIEETGFYDIDIYSRGVGGSKENYVLVDGEQVGVAKQEGEVFEDCIVGGVYIEAGKHTITIEKYWGWIQIDKIILRKSAQIEESRFEVEPVLVNENADENTRRLMTYLCDIYGTDILSGQYCDGGMYGQENEIIADVTGGKYPAVLGLDMMDYTPSRVANGSTARAVENAIEYWDEGGIVTFCWHWNAPEKYLTGEWYSGFYTEQTNIDLADIMNGEDEEGYELLMQDIDAIAVQLQRLQDAGVPVLWRPLHEAADGWFWWGASGEEAYQKLYKLLYDRLTNEYGLNNLIWVWNGQGKEFYPGDEYVDIIGEDIYPGEKVYLPQTSRYLEALQYTDANKIVVLSENGCLFDPDLAIRDGAMWGYFETWGREFVVQSGSSKTLSEQYTEEDMWKKVYEHEHVITRDELPDLKNYPLEES